MPSSLTVGQVREKVVRVFSDSELRQDEEQEIQPAMCLLRILNPECTPAESEQRL